VCIGQLPTGWKGKCGLEMVTATDGSTEWVLPKDAAEFKRRGAEMLPGKQRSSQGPTTSDEQTPVPPPPAALKRRSESTLKAQELVQTFLQSKCELSMSQSKGYAEALVESGYDTEQNLLGLLDMPQEKWPQQLHQIIKVRVWMRKCSWSCIVIYCVVLRVHTVCEHPARPIASSPRLAVSGGAQAAPHKRAGKAQGRKRGPA
jgi:hypothetical protein